MSIMDDVADLLVLAGAGVKATNLFVGTMPDGPDSCVSVMAYQGLDPMYVMEQAAPAYERPSFQVLVRGVGTIDTEARARTCHDYLAAVSNREVNGRWYLSIRPNSPPFPLPRDGNQRDLWVVNAQATHRS